MSPPLPNSAPGHAPTGQSLRIDHVTHRFGTLAAVDDVNLLVERGTIVGLLGPSGCGKTTLLRIVAGFVNQSAGHVMVDDQVIDRLPPERRKVGIVFQNYALFPHMTAAENITYGLAATGATRVEQRTRLAEMLALVKMEELAGHYPKQLSGGQQQRVALARALAIRPTILLLDEPFAALDRNLRLDMQIEVKRIQRLAGITTILVTHDQEEALSLADRVAIMNRGRIEQYAKPTEVYDRPATFFANTFVGTVNVLPGRVVDARPGTAVVLLEDGTRMEGHSAGALTAGTLVVVCIRPENLTLASDAKGIRGVVEMALPLGPTFVHEIRTLQGRPLKVSIPRTAEIEPLEVGTTIALRPRAPSAVNIFPASNVGY